MILTDKIERLAEDHIRCVCGNEPHLDGFYVSDRDGTTREGEYGPDPEWNGDTMTCYTCGVIFSLGTDDIIERATDEMLAGARLVTA